MCGRAKPGMMMTITLISMFQERGETLTEVLNIMTVQATTVRTSNHYHTLKLQLLILHGIYLV